MDPDNSQMDTPIPDRSPAPASPQTTTPLLVYDGDCSFCRFWVEYWKWLTKDQVRFAPFQEVANQLPEVPLENFRRSVQLFLPDGRVLSAAHAVFYSLTLAPGRRRRYRVMLWLYRRVPGVGTASEWFYRLVAAHRGFFYKINLLFWGRHFVPLSYCLTRWFFLRSLGIVYLIAFLSLHVQLAGLMGQHGILPAAGFLRSAGQSLGPQAYLYYPTLAWLNSSDRFLWSLADGGALASFLVVLGIATAPCLVIAWVCYLSLVTVGGDFMSFQWDILLLETGFLAIFFAPWQLLAPHWAAFGRKSKLRMDSAPSIIMLWVLRWLLFRLLFMSGAVKLLSGDPMWRSLSALDYHYYTQPLPTPVAWYMAQLPRWFQHLSVATMFFIELCIPFLIFAPRRLRLAGAALAAFLQVMIGVTGNYTFFNMLTLVLCVLVLDDRFLRRFLPRRLASFMTERVEDKPTKPEMADSQLQPASAPVSDRAAVPAGRARAGPGARTGRLVRASVAVVIFVASLSHEVARLSRGAISFRPALQLVNLLEPFHIVNGYGLFAVMTTTRLEIMVEGSNDGEKWLDYEFEYKPGDLKRPPCWVEPHQPRLDWQMWFAALGSYDNNPWFINFMVRLLEGTPEVQGLLAKNPFPDAPPRFVRATVYDYRFTNFAARKATGAWWQRELKGAYFPIVSLKSGGGAR